jgi:hypothetical protein
MASVNDVHPRVVYIWSQAMQDAADALPANIGRSSMVHDLIHSLDLLEPAPVATETDPRTPEGAESQGMEQTARVMAPEMELGTAEALRRYHDTKYVGELFSFGGWNTTGPTFELSKQLPSYMSTCLCV